MTKQKQPTKPPTSILRALHQAAHFSVDNQALADAIEAELGAR